jgi:hypothetical protein
MILCLTYHGWEGARESTPGGRYNSVVFGALATKEWSVVIAASDLDPANILNYTTQGFQRVLVWSDALGGIHRASTKWDLQASGYRGVL